jgi:predicted KAP-like P-loop ATPase
MSIEAALKNLDQPIQSIEEDLLQRSGFVENLCRIFSNTSPDESAVFALLGEWGSGKTSVKNLLVKELAKRDEKSPISIEFNPWAFSGQDQVLEAFFFEIGKSIGANPNGEKAAEGFKKLGAYLSYGAKTVKTIHVGLDLFGIPGSKIVGMIGEQLEGGSKNTKDYGEDLSAVNSSSLQDVQKNLKDALTKLNRPVLIILDDLDRLTPDQLLTIFQIVKQNANLPGLNYLLLMDMETIADRLEKKGLGPEFVEKIVQFDLTLPHVSGEDLKVILKEGFIHVMGKYQEQINWDRWEEAWTNGAQNLFTTLRRVKRFLYTLRFSQPFFASDDVLEVDPVDLFLIEAIRKYAPNTYASLPGDFRNSLIFEGMIARVVRLRGKKDGDDLGKRKLTEIVATAPVEHKPAIEHVLKFLFPQVLDSLSDEVREEALRDSRVCNPLSFDAYFRMAIPTGLVTQQEMSDLFQRLSDVKAFRALLMALYQKTGLANLFHLIHCHRKKLNPQHVCNLLGELWWLEDFDAKKAGVERDWTAREHAQPLTVTFLKDFCPREKRIETVVTALKQSKAVYPLAFLWCRLDQALTKDPQLQGLVFDRSELDSLRPLIQEEIHDAAANGSLLEMPDLNWLLMFWENIESKDAVKAWGHEQQKNTSKLITILQSLINKTTISGHRGAEYKYSIPKEFLAQVFDPIEELEPQLAAVERSKLTHWGRFAVEEALKRIDEKKRGNQAAEDSGM